MAMLINDNDTLRKYVPNTLKAVAGELSLFDKIQYHLLQAEQWLTGTFISSDTMSRIRTYSDSTPLLHYCRIITAAEAMLHAVPQLDLILTPNGFGIVSNRLAKGNVFAEWKQSDTAKLFEDHGYKNKKESGGYFF